MTHLKQFSHLESNFKCRAEADTCVCRCDKAPTACYQKNRVFANAYIHGNIFFGSTLQIMESVMRSVTLPPSAVAMPLPHSITRQTMRAAAARQVLEGIFARPCDKVGQPLRLEVGVHGIVVGR